jgi:hypothetical protein
MGRPQIATAPDGRLKRTRELEWSAREGSFEGNQGMPFLSQSSPFWRPHRVALLGFDRSIRRKLHRRAWYLTVRRSGKASPRRESWKIRPCP